MRRTAALSALSLLFLLSSGLPANQAQPPRQNQDALPPRATQKPPLHGRHWMALTGKPLAATAGAMAFQQGGNAIDAACAMLGAVSTMWDTLGWGGETQALIYNPKTKTVVGINALGVAPSGATVEYYKSKGYNYPPEFGPLAAVTPGTPGGLLVMLKEFGTLSLAQVLAPALSLARRARRRRPARSSVRPIWRRRSANLSRLSARRSPRANRAATRFKRRTIASTRATSRRKSCAASARTAASSRRTIWRSGR